MAKRDYYDVLGVGKSATADEVKRAHRKLARQFHPDMNKDNPDAARKFQEVQEAYDVISDANKRKMYDQFGHAAPMGGGDPFGGAGVKPGGYGTSGGTRQRRQWSPGGGATTEEFDPSDFGNGQFGEIFEQLFGSNGPFGRQPRGTGDAGRPVPTPRPADVEYPVSLSFEEAARGTIANFRIDRGDGSQETLEVRIPPGVKEGSRVRVRGHGEMSPATGQQGDLYIIVSVKPHPVFRRDGQDVLMDVRVSLYEAMLGGKVTVPTLDGNVSLSIPPNSSGGTKLRIKSRGIKRGVQSGDQIVILQIMLPTELDDDDKQLVRQLAERRPVNARG